MTTVVYDPENFRLSISGHAKAANGIDPVCAGASALAWAMVEAATNEPEYNASLLSINPEGPLIDVQCEPEDGAKEKCRYMFEIILGGLQLIAEAFPENMEIKMGGQGHG